MENLPLKLTFISRNTRIEILPKFISFFTASVIRSCITFVAFWYSSLLLKKPLSMMTAIEKILFHQTLFNFIFFFFFSFFFFPKNKSLIPMVALEVIRDGKLL